MRSDWSSLCAAAALTVLVAASMPAQRGAAQDLKYTTTTTMELGGAMGTIASMMPELGEPVLETTYIRGTRIRTDVDERSSVMDWSTGDMLEIDHVAREYVRFNVFEMAEAMAGVLEEGVTVEAAPAEQEEAEEADPQFEVRFSVDRTGVREAVKGYDAEQSLLVVEIVPIVPPDEDVEDGGQLAVVTELWLSTEFPEYQLMRDMQAEAAERFRESGAAQNMSQSLEGLESFDPRLREAWQENLEAMKELEGTALRSTVHFVTVPMGVQLDRDKVLAEADQGLGSAVAGAARESARDAARSVLGRFGRRQEEPEEPEPTQSVFMRIVTEIEDVETAILGDDLFGPPEGYTERPMEGPVGS